ncbi:uncharacterized protein L969DRAFT_95280 [Mixia osmundae IAM 14324]|uniref:MATE efflux family protein n=1 Tax=Mixia osmundae (strain CBS 9802 / IAM 14324 / JCM 22182 / KY 12970) TaxID=764103 RepID=G7E6M3_MIXOS|nr:uncharacterized protein L969DRAFT_95280 [Mixia osmundae IAM 14324]KEI39139.1 hypothetical protein L969DRAFT_95280 [Mixia osmundae IAM 14324]GAA98483.1 hypothetical protein E5Q_05169 [Mixia osmundae IAM 14324]
MADEHTALLPPGKDNEAGHIKGLLPPNSAVEVISRSETWILLRATRTIAITQLLEWSLYSVSVFLLGHLGTKYLAASTISLVTFNVLGISLSVGFSGALDTLCPHSWASHPKETSLHAQRMLFMLLSLAIVQCLVMSLAAEKIFLFLRQGEEISYLAAKYLRVQGFAIFPMIVFEVLRKYLQSMNLMRAPAIVIACIAPINIVLSYLLVSGPVEALRIGYLGTPISYLITSSLSAGLLAAYAGMHAREGHTGFTARALTNFGQMTKLGLASLAQTVSEWWTWEAIFLMSSQLGADYLASMSVCIATATLLYQLPMSLNIAASVRVGNLLGAERPDLAKVSAKTSMIISVLIGVFSAIVIFSLRNQWGRVFASDPEVIEIVANSLPLVSAFQVFDCLAGVTAGVLRGAGLPWIGAWLNVVCLLGIGVPLGGVLCFTAHLKINGLWLGASVALFLSATAGTIIVNRIRWEDHVNIVQREGLTEPDASESQA